MVMNYGGGDAMAFGGLMALMGAFFAVFLIIFIVVYLYMAFALMTIANKKRIPNSWLAFIPIGNLYIVTQIAKLPWWYLFAFVLGFIPVVGGILSLLAFGYIFWKMCEKLGKPGWWGILLLIPIVNLIIIGILAWGK